MKAVRLLEYGGQLVFTDVPPPTIFRDEILVKIKSTAVNHLDLVEASGTARQILSIDLPWIDDEPMIVINVSSYRAGVQGRGNPGNPALVLIPQLVCRRRI